MRRWRHTPTPQRTPLETEAPWFFLWVQGLLKLGDVTLIGVAVPLALVALLLAVPYLNRSPHRRLRRRPLALLLTVTARQRCIGPWRL